MALPKYDKSKRKRQRKLLPKGAYVVKIKGAREEENKKKGTGSHLSIAFDIAEGEYAGFFESEFSERTDEDKKWPNDGMFYINIPSDNSPEYVWNNYNTFFADLEDSNNGFVFKGNIKTLNGKLIGGKFALEQSEYQGRIYDHMRMVWTCVADDVRNGDPGAMPNDRLISKKPSSPTPTSASTEWMEVPDGDDEEVPF